MAFADTLLTETDAKIIIADKYPKPGGHWNVAYPYVTLHQPSQYYGVSSVELSKGRKDKVGLNQGLFDLATGPEILAYYDDVMKHQFLPSGRVQYFPMCEWQGEGKFTSMLSGDVYEVDYNKLVDATWLKTSVPATHTPSFKVDDNVWFIPLNDLTKIDQPPEKFVIIGAGKTGIDAVLWLLDNRVNPDKITWVMPRDAWLLNRKNTQPTSEFFKNTIGAQAGQFEAIVESTSMNDMFDRLEACGYFLRLDAKVRPQMFHGATVSEMELERLRTVKNIIRGERVRHITCNEIILDQTRLPTSLRTVHVDCSARAVSNEDIIPIFQGNLITPQMVRSYQPVFSAAMIAHVEAEYETDDKKNDLCGVVPLPNHDTDFVRFTSAFMMNQYKWSQDKGLRQWLLKNRLDGFSKMVAEVTEDEADKISILKSIRKNAPMAAMKLQQYLQELDRVA